MVELYAPLAYRWVRYAGVPADDAGDVVQEVFTAVLRSLDDFQDTGSAGSFRAWLHGITRHRVLDHFRRRQAEPQAQGGSAAQAALQQIPEPADSSASSDPQQLEDPWWRHAVEMVRLEFEDRTWEAFWRVAVEKQASADVAPQLHMSLDAVYQAKSRVLRRLREELRGLEPDAT